MNTENKDIKCNKCYKLLEGYCKEYRITLTKITPRQFRMELLGRRIDVYPLSNKYFDLVEQEWGTFSDVIQKIDDFFTE